MITYYIDIYMNFIYMVLIKGKEGHIQRNKRGLGAVWGFSNNAKF